MALMKWNAHFVTGIDLVDRQHQHLLQLVNDSAPVLARPQKQQPENTGELLDALTDYAINHFRSEDELMRRHGVDPRHYQHHLNKHADFASRIRSLRDQYERDESATGSDLLGFLANWLVFHILGEDQAMAQQIAAIQAGQSPADAYAAADSRHHTPAHNALTQAQVDLYALMTEQNCHLLEMNHALEQHRAHLEDEVAQRTKDIDTARQAAETANRAKSAFIANLSHEIRTPMNAIVGLTRTLQEQNKDPEQKGRLQQVGNSTQQLLGIINDLLDISRIESEQLSLEPLDFDLRQIVDHMVANHAGKAQQKGLNFSTTLPARLPALLHGDPLRIGQIIGNFVGNAIKFTQQGSVHLQLALSAGTAAHTLLLRCTVEDTGIGMSPEQCGQLFLPFEQTDQSTRRRFGGTGLGLAISKRLAEMMGGQVGVSSRLGHGSVFWFEIPLTATSRCGKSTGPRTAADPAGDFDPINWPDVDAALRQLARLLAEDDIASISLWRESAALLQPALGLRTHRLDEELNNYNFETALVMVQESLADLPDPSSPGHGN